MDRGKILIVDDELNIRLLVKNALDTYYIVLEASNGKEAIDMAHIHQPGLILMDILMPRLDGYTACHEIKKAPATRAIPVIMLTGVGYELNETLAKEMGADGYITKPFALHCLLNTVKEYELAPCLIEA